jgi:hypothetical protein
MGGGGGVSDGRSKGGVRAAVRCGAVRCNLRGGDGYIKSQGKGEEGDGLKSDACC